MGCCSSRDKGIPNPNIKDYPKENSIPRQNEVYNDELKLKRNTANINNSSSHQKQAQNKKQKAAQNSNPSPQRKNTQNYNPSPQRKDTHNDIPIPMQNPANIDDSKIGIKEVNNPTISSKTLPIHRKYSNSEEKEIENSYSYSMRSGIPNIGNSCYMNSVVQALAGSPHFLEILKNVRNATLVSLKNFIQGLKQGESSSNLKALASNFKNDISREYSNFRGAQENDAKELLVIILSILDEEVAENPFNITSNCEFQCNKGHLSKKQENSNLIVIPNRSSIKNYFKEIENQKVFSGENKLLCETCNDLKETTMKTVISCGKLLILYIAKAKNEKNKIECEDTIKVKGELYKLYAVICYDSNIRHFYEYERAPNKSWYEYNDIQAGESKRFPSKNAYLLFYQLIR